MKRFQIYCTGCLLLFAALSCKQEYYRNTVKIDHADFGEAIPLVGENVDFDEPLMMPVRMLRADSILLVHNLNMDPLVQKYNLNTRKKTGECISFGGGPEDMLIIWNMQKEDTTLWLTDTQKHTCFSYRISDICFKDTFKSLARISISERFQEAWIFPDQRAVTVGFNPDIKRFSFYSSSGELIRRTGEYPFFGSELTDLEKVEGFVLQMAVNYPANRIYLFYLATDLLEIYDLEGELIKRVHGPDHFFPVVREKRNGDMIRVGSQLNVSRDAFSSPVIVNDEIFVLYSGTYFTLESRNTKDHLLVYDKEGNPLRKYKLSDELYHIIVDADSRIIYGLCDDPEYHLLKFHY